MNRCAGAPYPYPERERRVDRLITSLAEEPRPAGCKKLKGYDNLYRLRTGDWRIIYAVEDAVLIVLVIEIAPRDKAYRER